MKKQYFKLCLMLSILLYISIYRIHASSYQFSQLMLSENTESSQDNTEIIGASQDNTEISKDNITTMEENTTSDASIRGISENWLNAENMGVKPYQIGDEQISVKTLPHARLILTLNGQLEWSYKGDSFNSNKEKIGTFADQKGIAVQKLSKKLEIGDKIRITLTIDGFYLDGMDFEITNNSKPDSKLDAQDMKPVPPKDNGIVDIVPPGSFDSDDYYFEHILGWSKKIHGIHSDWKKAWYLGIKPMTIGDTQIGVKSLPQHTAYIYINGALQLLNVEIKGEKRQLPLVTKGDGIGILPLKTPLAAKDKIEIEIADGGVFIEYFKHIIPPDKVNLGLELVADASSKPHGSFVDKDNIDIKYNSSWEDIKEQVISLIKIDNGYKIEKIELKNSNEIHNDHKFLDDTKLKVYIVKDTTKWAILSYEIYDEHIKFKNDINSYKKEFIKDLNLKEQGFSLPKEDEFEKSKKYLPQFSLKDSPDIEIKDLDFVLQKDTVILVKSVLNKKNLNKGLIHFINADTGEKLKDSAEVYGLKDEVLKIENQIKMIKDYSIVEDVQEIKISEDNLASVNLKYRKTLFEGTSETDPKKTNYVRIAFYSHNPSTKDSKSSLDSTFEHSALKNVNYIHYDVLVGSAFQVLPIPKVNIKPGFNIKNYTWNPVLLHHNEILNTDLNFKLDFEYNNTDSGHSGDNSKPENPQSPKNPKDNAKPQNPQSPKNPKDNAKPQNPQSPKNPKDNAKPENPQSPKNPKDNAKPENPQNPKDDAKPQNETTGKNAQSKSTDSDSKYSMEQAPKFKTTVKMAKIESIKPIRKSNLKSKQEKIEKMPSTNQNFTSKTISGNSEKTKEKEIQPLSSVIHSSNVQMIDLKYLFSILAGLLSYIIQFLSYIFTLV